MNIICVLKGCDWEKISQVTEKFVIDYLLEDKFVRYARRELKTRRWRRKVITPIIPHNQRKERLLGQYVCLRCCAVRDDIKDFLADCKINGYKEIKKEQQKARRKERAEFMLKNCAKEKFKRIYR